jgi:hypothetical protein
MTDGIMMKKIAAQVAGLRQAMEAVMNGTTPDHAKWSAASSFARKYSAIALHYINITGDQGIQTYNNSKIPNSADMVWPAQKSLFDLIYTDVLILENSIKQVEPLPTLVIYNLLVAGSEDSWDGDPFQIDISRCVREYTLPEITKRYGNFDPASISELKRAPCLFAYESGCRISPRFGYITEIVSRQGQVRIEYNIQKKEDFLTLDQFSSMSFELDIAKYEMHRTHWAVKLVNLPKELHAKGIAIPSSLQEVSNAVDISNHEFEVALSFPGEVRPLIEGIVKELERRIGPNRYFYDNNYVSQLAQPSLDKLLQGIYRRSILDVVFLSADYQRKNWCGVEFRAISEIIFGREHSRVMFIRTDEGEVEGVFKTDGYLDARKFGPEKIAELICERLHIVKMALSSK